MLRYNICAYIAQDTNASNKDVFFKKHFFFSLEMNYKIRSDHCELTKIFVINKHYFFFANITVRRETMSMICKDIGSASRNSKPNSSCHSITHFEIEFLACTENAKYIDQKTKKISSMNGNDSRSLTETIIWSLLLYQNQQKFIIIREIIMDFRSIADVIGYCCNVFLFFLTINNFTKRSVQSIYRELTTNECQMTG